MLRLSLLFRGGRIPIDRVVDAGVIVVRRTRKRVRIAPMVIMLCVAGVAHSGHVAAGITMG